MSADACAEPARTADAIAAEHPDRPAHESRLLAGSLRTTEAGEWIGSNVCE